MSQRGAQTYESRILELTNQVAVVMREKSAAEESIRQLQRELAGKDNENKAIREEMETLQGQLTNQSTWTRERQVSHNYIFDSVCVSFGVVVKELL